MVIVFEVLSKIGRSEVVCTQPNEAFVLACILGSSSTVVAWRMTNHTPQSFGWVPIMPKYASRFTTKHFAQTN